MGRDIQASAPVGETGDLSSDWDVATSTAGNGAVSVLKFNTEYASFQDEGTGPHPIHGNPLLAFDGGFGQTVIVRSVQHPGSTVRKGWFSDKAEDDSLWGTLAQAATDAYSWD